MFNANLVNREVPLFSLRPEDEKDIKYIKAKAILCITISLGWIIFYILGIIFLIVGLMNYQTVNPNTYQFVTNNGMLGLWILGVIFIVFGLSLIFVRLVFEWKIAKKNRILMKYDQGLQNNVIRRYVDLCQGTPFVLFIVLANPIFGFIVDLWLIKKTKKVLSLSPLDPTQEQQAQEAWIQKFVSTNATDPRIQNAYQNYYNQNQNCNFSSINWQPNNFNNNGNFNKQPTNSWSNWSNLNNQSANNLNLNSKNQTNNHNNFVQSINSEPSTTEQNQSVDASSNDKSNSKNVDLDETKENTN